jgi:hypothetical protein
MSNSHANKFWKESKQSGPAGSTASWDSHKKNAVPPEFRGIKNSARPTLEADGITVTYLGQRMSRKEYSSIVKRWNETYKNIVYLDPVDGKKRTKHETVAFRTSTTTDEQVRQACWDKLPWITEEAWSNLDIGVKVPEEIKRLFKVDMYGNVIAMTADNYVSLLIYADS